MAEAEAEAPAPAAETPAPAAETEPETKKRKYAEHGSYSSATKAKMAKTAPTVEGWKEHHPWLVWDGDFDNGMACASCLATGKTGDAFTAEGGCTNFMLKSLQAHEKVHHKGFGVAGSAQAQAESASEAASAAALKAAARAEGLTRAAAGLDRGGVQQLEASDELGQNVPGRARRV